MSNRTFLGLIFLIVALFIASIPELLAPTTRGVEFAGAKLGLIDDPAPSKAKAGSKDAPDPDELVDRRLALNGYVVEDDGDLRDSVDLVDREANARGRLMPGTSRVPLPGERVEAPIPPAMSEDGVLLDVTGCPMFRPDTDVELLLSNPDTLQLYADKAADADDPEACRLVLNDRIATATAAPTSSPLGEAVARDRAAIRRGDVSDMVIALAEIELLAGIMDDEALQDALAALDESGSTTAAGTTGASASATPAATTTTG